MLRRLPPLPLPLATLPLGTLPLPLLSWRGVERVRDVGVAVVDGFGVQLLVPVLSQLEARHAQLLGQLLALSA